MNDDEIYATLNEYRPWLIRTALGIKSDPAQAEELMQEGWIAMWRALIAYDELKGELYGYLVTQARWRMLSIATGSAYLLSSERHVRMVSIGHKTVIPPTVEVPTTTGLDNPVMPEVDSMITAYHHGEIYAAINEELTPVQRERVFKRFWLGIVDGNTTWWNGRPASGKRLPTWNTVKYPNGRVQGRAYIGARDRLRKRLGHLKGIEE